MGVGNYCSFFVLMGFEAMNSTTEYQTAEIDGFVKVPPKRRTGTGYYSGALMYASLYDGND